MSALELSLSVKTEVSSARTPDRRIRRWVVRGLTVLGGSVAGTAAAWALTSVAASADLLDGDGLLSDAPAVKVATNVVEDVTGTVSGELAATRDGDRFGEAFDIAGVGSDSLQVELSPGELACNSDVFGCSTMVAPVEPQLDRLIGGVSVLGAAGTAANTASTRPAEESYRPWFVDDEVADRALWTAPLRSGGPAAWLRTASGTEQSTGGVDDAVPHSPASTPLSSSAPTASAAAAGSSLVFLATALTGTGHGDDSSGQPVSDGDLRKPNSIGVQPGTAPD